MVFLFIIPSIPAALGNFFLPLMLGAKDVAFPRLNLLSWYVYLFGSVFAVVVAHRGGAWTPAGRSTRPTPPSPMPTTGGWCSWSLGVFILGFSSIFTGINFVVTVHKLRAPGMGWFDMPLFVWAIYATAIIQVLATPVLGDHHCSCSSSSGCSTSASSIRRWAATRCCSSTSSGSTATRRCTS
jgi:cytochrome c oxidase subunit I